MKKTEAKELAKKVLWLALDDLEYKARESWALEDLSEEDKDTVEQIVFTLIAAMKKKNS